MNYQKMAEQAKAVRTTIATASTNTKNSALLAIRDAMAASRSRILKANQQDLDAGRSNGLDSALLDRLELNDARIDAMIEGVEQIVALPDPVGEISRMTRRTSGIEVGLMRQPLGVIGI
ncbi:MAG: gamma-glutamyl-phosphate reductase, partial [Gammaproteobacteria bacterium]